MATKADRLRRLMLQACPLFEGEEVQGQLLGWASDGEGAKGEEVLLLYTGSRVGVHFQSGTPFLVHWVNVQAVGVGGGAVRVDFDNGVIWHVLPQEEDGFWTFYANFWATRCCFICAKGHEKLFEAYRLIGASDLVQAAKCLMELSEIETFHPGPRLLLFVLYRWFGMGKDAASQLVAAAPATAAISPRSLPLLWTSARLGTVDLHRLSNALEEGFDSPGVQWCRMLLQALLEARRGREDVALQHIRQAVEIADGSPVDLLMTVGTASETVSMSHLDGVRVDLQSRMAKAIQAGSGEASQEEMLQAQHFCDLMFRLLDSSRDRISGANAVIELSAIVGDPSGGASGYRLLEQWTEIPELTGSSEPAAEVFEASPEQVPAFLEVFEWFKGKWSPMSLSEYLWALVRLKREQEVVKIIGEKPEEWFQTYPDALDCRQHEVWLTALVVTETLILVGRPEAGLALLRNAYQTISPAIGNDSDPYLEKASELYGLYSAIATRDVPRCRLFLGLLDGQDCFRWTQQMVARELPEALQSPLLASDGNGLVGQFSHWLAAARTQPCLRSAGDLEEALGQLRAAQEARTLRVVVGGETSSGKSSFVNALLEYPVLHVTQEEATAIPTHLVQAPVWRARACDNQGVVLDSFEVQGGGTLGEFAAFVKRYTFLGSRDSQRVARLEIGVPLTSLPAGIEFIDTPGLNAHALRTKLAEDAIDTAHACIFVLDARNALKAGEMKKISWAAGAVGKTLFVINKMDLALGDDDLDCDADSHTKVLERVRRELCASLGVEKVNLFAVSSVGIDRLRASGAPQEALRFAESVKDVRGQLMKILSTSRETLISYAAGKVARVAANVAYRHAMKEVAARESELGRLTLQLPDDPEVFRDYVMNMVGASWLQVRSQYIERMQAAYNEAMERVGQKVVQGLNGCADREQVKAFVSSRVRPIFNGFVSEMDRTRAVEWSREGRSLLQVCEGFFNELYEGLVFEANYDSSRLLNLATPIPMAGNIAGLKGAVEGMANDAVFNEMGGAAAGAALGSFILPGFGTIIGGVLGGMFGSSLNEDFMQKVHGAIMEQASALGDQIIDALNADINSSAGNPPPMLQAIADKVDEERERFAAVVLGQMDRTKKLLADAERAAEAGRSVAVQAGEWSTRFQSYLAVH